MGPTYERWRKKLQHSLSITDQEWSRQDLPEMMLQEQFSHLSLEGQGTWVSWLEWDRRTATSETRHSPREVSSLSSTLSSTESLPTGTTWRRSGITPSTTSLELHQRSTQFSSLRLHSTQRQTERR